MAEDDRGSLTKEPTLAAQDATIRAITPSMQYAELLAYARANSPITHPDAPGLVAKRYLLINPNKSIAYDHFLSLTKVHKLESLFLRKIMYFLWAYRDDRIRDFVCTRIADGAGHWEPSRLQDKANAKFFEKWMKGSSAKKARSNFEFFLIETGIFDQKTRAINLDLADGWLEQAVIAAAQHEKDLLTRKELLADPIAFLKKRKWHGLLNIGSGPEPLIITTIATESEPLEDSTISISPSSPPTPFDWDRPSPGSSAKKTTTATIDLVERERANKSHHSLEEILANLARANGHSPKYTQNIDLFFETSSGTVLAEIKSCTDTNFHSQVRKAVSQLLEYRFVNESILGSKVTMLLILETAPPVDKKWLIDYLQSLEIVAAWKDATTEKIVSSCTIPTSLSGILISSS